MTVSVVRRFFFAGGGWEGSAEDVEGTILDVLGEGSDGVWGSTGLDSDIAGVPGRMVGLGKHEAIRTGWVMDGLHPIASCMSR